jgi:hypothetical protein
MRPIVLLLSMTALTLPLFGLPARPVSDLALGDELPCMVAAVASDGDDFLIVCDIFNDGAWGQIIEDGEPAGPLFFIGRGSGGMDASAVWTGSQYIVSWCAGAGKGTYTVPVSRRGALGEPTKIYDGCRVHLAALGERVLFVGNDGRGGLLDGNGRPASPALELYSSEVRERAVTATRDGFALATFGYSRTAVILLDRDGKPRSEPITVEGPYVSGVPGHSATGRIASDGDNVLVAFLHYEPGKLEDLRTAIVARDGRVVRAAKPILAGNHPQYYQSVVPRTLIWNGSEFLAGLLIAKSQLTSDGHLLRISASGERVGEPAQLPGSFHIVAAGSSARENLIALHFAAPKYVLTPRGSSVPGTARPLGRALSQHKHVAVAATGDLTLAIWGEKHGDKWQVRASRIDRSGRYLDGAGLLLDTVGTVYGVAAEGDGTNWLAAWAAPGGAGIRAKRISPSGAILDAQPMGLGFGSELSIRAGNGKWMVAATLSSLDVIPVRADGTVEQRRKIGQESANMFYAAPAVVFDGARFLVGAIHRKDVGQQGDYEEQHFAMTSVNASGVPADAAPVFIAKANESPLTMATNGTTSLAVFARGGKSIGLLLPSRVEVEIANSRGPAAAAWDGSAFVVALKDSDDTLKIARVTPEGTVSMQAASSFRVEPMTKVALSGDMVGFLSTNETWGPVPQASVAFLGDFSATAVPPPPAAQLAAQVAGDVLRVRWAPATNALGVIIDLRLDDGSYRPIGTAAAAAGTIDLPLDGLSGTAVRLRAWNAIGMSEPSNDAAIASVTRRRPTRK